MKSKWGQCWMLMVVVLLTLTATENAGAAVARRIGDHKRNERNAIFQAWVSATAQVVHDIKNPKLKQEATVTLSLLQKAVLGYPLGEGFSLFDRNRKGRLAVVVLLPSDKRTNRPWNMFTDYDVRPLYVIWGHYIVIRDFPSSSKTKGSLLLSESSVASIATKQRSYLSVEAAEYLARVFDQRLFADLLGQSYQDLLQNELQRIGDLRRKNDTSWMDSHPDASSDPAALRKSYLAVLGVYFPQPATERERKLQTNRLWLSIMLRHLSQKDKQMKFLDQVDTELVEGESMP